MESINKLRYPKYVLGNILVVLALLLSATQADSENKRKYVHPLLRNLYQKRIVGGKTTMPHSWPWQVGLWHASEHQCGGSLLDNFFVVTAAHCLFHNGQFAAPEDISVRLGDHYLDYEDWGEYRRTVSSYSVHPLYNANAFNDFDIALLRLSTPANFSATVAPIKLPAAPPQDNQTCLAAGWGQIHPENPLFPKGLKEIYMKIVNKDVCNDFNKKKVDKSGPYYRLTDKMICAKSVYSNLGHNPCNGDSGGPLVCNDPGRDEQVLQGIISFGTGGLNGSPCDGRLFTAVFTKVFNLKWWIESEKLKMN